jgi:GNAT superfamily N-acetyltransferase
VLNESADDLTTRFGRGHWSFAVSEAAALRGLRTSTVLLARDAEAVVGTLRLVTKKPWAIDISYFTPVKRALYLVDMAVSPAYQRSGVGRRLLEEARDTARCWPADGIRLNAYDAEGAGAGRFYERCGFVEVGRVSYRGTPLIYFESRLDR